MFTRICSVVPRLAFLVVVGVCSLSAIANADSLKRIALLDLVQLRDIGGDSYGGAISLSPDGNWIAFQLQEPNLSTNNFRLTWFVVSARGGALRSLGDGGELDLNPMKAAGSAGSRFPVRAVWSRDSSRFYYLKKSAGAVQIWRSTLSDGRQEQLTQNAADVLAFHLSDDGKRIVFSVARPRDAVQAELEEEGGRGFLVDDRFRHWVKPMPSRRLCSSKTTDDAVALDGDCVPKTWEYELASAKETPVITERAPVAETAGRTTKRSPNGLEVAQALAVDSVGAVTWSPMLRLHVTDEKGASRPCPVKECVGDAFGGVWWSDDGEEVYFLIEDRGRGTRHLRAWRQSTNIVRNVLDTTDLLQDCDARRSNVVCLHESWATPRKVVEIDLQTGAVQSLYNPNPQFDDIAFTRMEKLVWRDAFGNLTFGVLVYPRGYVAGKRYPLVVAPYSAHGFKRGDAGDEYPIHVFADAGLMVLNAQVPFDGALLRRLPKGSWADLRAAMNRGERSRRSALSSLENILDALVQRGLVDPARVGMTGFSAAAVQTHYAIINSNRIATAAVSQLVTPDLWWYFMESPLARSNMARDFWSSANPSCALRSYRALSYPCNVKKIRTPLLANVSDQEFPLVLKTLGVLQDAGRAIEVHAFPGEYHNKWQPRHRLSIYRRNLQWFLFWLRGEEVGDPLDPEQSARWRAMRVKQCELFGKEPDAPWYCRP